MVIYVLLTWLSFVEPLFVGRCNLTLDLHQRIGHVKISGFIVRRDVTIVICSLKSKFLKSPTIIIADMYW